jgi:hypothetical protein
MLIQRTVVTPTKTEEVLSNGAERPKRKYMRRTATLDNDPPKKRVYGVSNESFVRTWQLSNSVDEVIERTRLKRSGVFSRKAFLKKHGVNLKTMPRRPGMKSQLDVDALNRLIGEIEGELAELKVERMQND